MSGLQYGVLVRALRGFVSGPHARGKPYKVTWSARGEDVLAAADAIEALEARALAAEKERDEARAMQEVADAMRRPVVEQLSDMKARVRKAEGLLRGHLSDMKARVRKAEGLLRGHSCGYKIGNPMTPEPCEICKFLAGRTETGALLAGLPIRVNNDMPKDEIRIVDGDSKVLVKMVNVGGGDR